MTHSYFLLTAGMLSALLVLTLLTCVARRIPWLSRPPAIDFLVALFTLIPWITGSFLGLLISHRATGALAGLALTVLAQLIALELFDLVHSRIRVPGHSRLKINPTLTHLHGLLRNRLGLWITVPAVPGFLLIRFFQAFFYPPLVALLHFKPFRQSDYISVSRHKIENLVGADLVWCLYCDWMTGQWSLGTEMLNQVESFWCPLAFADRSKCEKCAQFFDMTRWAPSHTTPAQMEQVILTIQGATPKPQPASTPEPAQQR
jgi:hypothetical protein